MCATNKYNSYDASKYCRQGRKFPRLDLDKFGSVELKLERSRVATGMLEKT
jgi:hypothetical protein